MRFEQAALEEWDETRKEVFPLVMHPEATCRKYWDIGSVVLILYSCFTVPYFLVSYLAGTDSMPPANLLYVFSPSNRIQLYSPS